jgi:hypothetical protein
LPSWAADPKPSAGGTPSLKRLNSGEKWDGSQSFYSGWKPPSSLKRLLSAIRQAQADDPNQFVGLQRKPTGFVPASTPAALPADSEPHGVGVKHADATDVADLTAAELQRAHEQEHLAATHRQLAALQGGPALMPAPAARPPAHMPAPSAAVSPCCRACPVSLQRRWGLRRLRS